ncbi:hypothetical protein PQU92_05135 [Asticcacaulis sp. BYS171W]|uniref:Uncharacterized protein n=1 Tax=Asticcacaulis aquaticus TaxID=2984212 RepID=A0ABT5HRE9_9CAUL|nr:hypothetical protein [Asticcacaulis aquaticus]MDC7682648.1 hypothetical protein [Asticcacaulis aquaticus]
MDIRTTFMPSLTTGGMAEKLKALKAEKLSAQKQAMEDVRDVPRKVRDDTRARAKEKLMQLFERMKIIKKLGENDPKMMAKLLAQAMKELKAIVKEYVRAGGNSSDVSGYAAAQVTASTPVPDEAKDGEAAEVEASDVADEAEAMSEDVPSEAVEDNADIDVADKAAETPETTDTSETTDKPQTPLEAKTAAEAYVKTERDRAQGELMEVGEFMRLVRGFMKATKELLETAKIKLAFQTVGKDTVEDFRSSYEDMKEIEEEFEDLSKGLDDERAVFGPKSVLYA